jgi:uncharacterized spore protein YtfJ
MPDVFESIQGAVNAMRERISVTTAYGEPVSANGVTVIPVSKVRFGFGGGGGAGGEGESTGSGGGLGGGGAVEPLGYIEISDAGTRWMPLEPPRAEVFLRVIGILPAFLPMGRGGGGLLRRIMLFAIAQAIIGGIVRQRMQGGDFPSFPRRGHPAEKAA